MGAAVAALRQCVCAVAATSACTPHEASYSNVCNKSDAIAPRCAHSEHVIAQAWEAAAGGGLMRLMMAGQDMGSRKTFKSEKERQTDTEKYKERDAERHAERDAQRERERER